MSKFESFVKKGQEDVKKAAKIGTLAVGIGAGVISGADNVQAQVQNRQESSRENTSSLNFSKERKYDLSEKKYIGEEIRKVQENPDSLLASNIEKVKNALNNAKELTIEAEDLDRKKQLINAYEEYLINPSLDIISVGDVDFNQENFSQNNEDFAFYDDKIQQLAEHIKSPEYLKKLMLEYEIDEQAAKEHQLIRLNNLYNGGYYLGDNSDSYYERDDKTFSVVLPKDHRNHEFYAEHELLGHKIIDHNNFSRKAAKLMSKSSQQVDFKAPEFRGYFKNSSGDYSEDEKRVLGNYFGSLSERYARKNMLEAEMESLGIKKYGEEFTDRHYEQLIDLYKKGELSKGSRQFISTTKPEYFKIIFNEIAENNLAPEDEVRENQT